MKVGVNETVEIELENGDTLRICPPDGGHEGVRLFVGGKISIEPMATNCVRLTTKYKRPKTKPAPPSPLEESP